MDISALIFNVDQGQLTLPCFARDFVWRPSQVRSFFASLYRGYPLGTFIFWMPSAAAAAQMPELPKHLPAELVVDGQQRIASVYGVVRGQLPLCYKHQEWEFPKLRFNLADETFSFRQAAAENDPLSIDLQDYLGSKPDRDGVTQIRVYDALRDRPLCFEYMRRLHKLKGILDRKISVECLPDDTTLKEAVDIYLTANGANLHR